MPRRRTLLTAAALPLLAGATARAQRRFGSLYMLIPAAPGGGWDGLGRALELVAKPAGLVGTVQFENVGGAGGTVGLARFVAQRRGRGDSLFVAGAITVGAAIANKSPVGLQDVVPVARLTEEAGAIVVPAASEFRDLRQFLDALKANPGAVAVAGGSTGGIDHLTLGTILGALGRGGREASYVAYQSGSQAAAAAIGGQVKAALSGWSEFAEQVKAGRLRALAGTGERRQAPDVPTLKESGVGVVTTNWRGVFGAPGISAQDRGRLIELVTEIHALPAWRELLRTRGWDDAFLTGDAFAEFIRRDAGATEAVLRDIGLI